MLVEDLLLQDILFLSELGLTYQGFCSYVVHGNRGSGSWLLEQNMSFPTNTKPTVMHSRKCLKVHLRSNIDKYYLDILIYIYIYSRLYILCILLSYVLYKYF